MDDTSFGGATEKKMSASKKKTPSQQSSEDSCKFCSRKACYTCPRCHARYCSSGCYKQPAHASCSEQFYKECVLTELQQSDNSDEVKQKTLHILKRAAEQQGEEFEDSDDECVLPSLEERFADIDLEGEDIDTDQIWSRLTEEEKKEFEHLRQEYRLEELVPPWEPWWQHKVEPQLVQEMGKDSQLPCDQSRPAVLKKIEPLKTIMPKAAPSLNVAYSIVNILYAYATTARLHDGDHQKMVEDAAEVVMSVSTSLSKKENFDDVATAACSAMKAARELSGFSLNTSYLLTVIQDLIKILEGPNPINPALYTLSALSDLHDLLIKAAKKSKNGGRNNQCYKTGAKKVLFLLSWVQDFGGTLQSLLPNLKLLHDETLSETVAQQLQEEQQKASCARIKTQQKPLIQEVNS